MPPIAIITDTDSSIPIEIAKKYHIVQVPIIVQFGNETFQDVYEIDNKVIFERIDREGKFPTTAAPSPGQFSEAFKSAIAAGAKSIVCFTVSSEVSATYASARNAAEMFPDKDITVVDTRSLCMGQGLMVLSAAEEALKGAPKEKVIATAQAVGKKVHLFAALSTLKYLAMSGRVGHLAAGLAGLLDVKPILTIIDGKLQLLERVRIQSKSWARTVEVALEATGGNKIKRMVILHAKASKAAEEFEKLIRTSLPFSGEPMYAEMNPGLSIHSGAGLVGLAFETE